MQGSDPFWQKPKPFSPTREQREQAVQFKIDPLVLHLIDLRAVKGEEEIENYLQPRLSLLPDPFIMKDMKKAAILVSEAIKTNSEIVIWGDYDVDGITGSCLLHNFFMQIGVEATVYIPNRFTEGYGLNSKGIEKLRTSVKSIHPLLITVDCGISNPVEIRRAAELGFRTLITDHHTPPEKRIDADAILNAKQTGCRFTDKNLAGVGIAFYLAAGIRSHLNSLGYFTSQRQSPNLKQFLDFVAIGTIADMVPLNGINRILVKSGFEVLAMPAQKGVSALLQGSDISPGTITSDDIAFQIAPKINAAGRMGKTDAAIELLLCSDEKKAATLSKRLAELNTKRKKLCADIIETTSDYVVNSLNSGDYCIILSGDYHQGVIGIAASQVSQSCNLPVILLTHDPSVQGRKVLKGSGRSIPGIDLFGILSQCDRYLLKYGGHPMAAGLSLLEENLEKFKADFRQLVKSEMVNKTPCDAFKVDMELPLEKFFEKGIAEQISRMEPYGVGNKRPVFLDPAASIYDYKLLGSKGDHVKLFFRCMYSNRQGMGFNLGHKKDILKEQCIRSVIYSPALNRYKNSISWEVRILDIF